MKTRPVRVHVPVDSGSRTHDEIKICVCGEPWTRRVHQVAPTSDEAAEVTARILGESGE